MTLLELLAELNRQSPEALQSEAIVYIDSLDEYVPINSIGTANDSSVIDEENLIIKTTI